MSVLGAENEWCGIMIIKKCLEICGKTVLRWQVANVSSMGCVFGEETWA